MEMKIQESASFLGNPVLINLKGLPVNTAGGADFSQMIFLDDKTAYPANQFFFHGPSS
jgi:hypothetical protein